MSFFSKGKRPGPGGKTTKKRDVVTMICPECQHEQPESKIAISTYCRGCSSHYKIDHGKAVANIKYPSNPFASSNAANSDKPTEEDPEAAAAVARNTTSDGQVAPSPCKQATNQAPIRRTTPPSSQLAKKTVTTCLFS